VLIGNLPAARVGDMAVCVGPPDKVSAGSSGVMINGKPAARLGDSTAHGGKIVVGCPTVLIGGGGGGGGSTGGGTDANVSSTVIAGADVGANANTDPKSNSSKNNTGSSSPASFNQNIEAGITVVERSNFAKTTEGKKVLAKIKDLHSQGKIKSVSLPSGTLGQWSGSEILVPDWASDPNFIASSVLVHEATHALNEDEIPESKQKFVIDEELRCNENELDLYEEQRSKGYRNQELERRRSARKNGKLRDDVRSRYPGLPEHL
jgi:hypothetical protein